MSTRLWALWVGALAGAALAACQRPGGDGIGPDYEQIPSASVPVVWASAAGAGRATPASMASGSATAAGSAMGSASGPVASASAPVADASASAAKPAAKVFDCGDKGKPDCPMQKWMKGVAGGAVASGDTDRLAKAFLGMSKAPPGFGGWTAITAAGAAKAQAGDFDGAKAQCKVCHTKFQSRYHATVRDLKWP